MSIHQPLSPELIIAAYRGGYFPMPDPETDEILWYNPDPRTIIPLEGFH
ncbi:MAG: leucyl/phenylalanyl-tRNA--protein transferase, partial [Pseudomonadota bacterium]